MCGIAKPRPPKSALVNYIGIELEQHGGSGLESGADLGQGVRADWEYHGSFHGYEFSMLAKEDEFIEPLTHMVNQAKRTGGRFVPGCGLHVHLDARLRSPQVMQRALVTRLDELRKFVSADRLATRGYGHDFVIGREGYETLEVRTMDASDNLRLIIRYVNFLIATVNVAVATQPVLAKAA